MIANVKELEKKLIDKDMNRKMLAKSIGINPYTLTLKLEDKNAEFKISEAVRVAKELELTVPEFLMIFFGKELSRNESCESSKGG